MMVEPVEIRVVMAKPKECSAAQFNRGPLL
jgi:hypothetical protein